MVTVVDVMNSSYIRQGCMYYAKNRNIRLGNIPDGLPQQNNNNNKERTLTQSTFLDFSLL